jgi:hypothetical protein
MNRLTIKDFRLKILAILLFLFIIHLSLIINPVFAQDEITCTDHLGTHDVGTEWPGGCRDTSGNATIFSCDHTGTIQARFESNHPECGSTLNPDTRTGTGDDVNKIFGTIKAPDALKPFLGRGGNAASGISFFLNNLVVLIYTVAAVVFIFMILWGAFEMVTSGGEKEKVGEARKRITYAFIGIVLFAIAFAIISLVGTFTGFNFFQNPHNPQCPLRAGYYYDANVDTCFYSYSTGPECTVQREAVNKSQCTGQ